MYMIVSSDQEKTASEKARERVLLQELLETVNMRNSIVDSMEEDRIRYTYFLLNLFEP